MAQHRFQSALGGILILLIAARSLAPTVNLPAETNSAVEQQVYKGTVKGGWKQDIPYDQPSTQVKMSLSGSEAVPKGAGALITDLTIKVFPITGGPPQLIAETPECFYDHETEQISSTNVLKARSGDGKFYVEGTGFLWQQTSPDLVLSSRVQTVIREAALGTNATTKTNMPATFIFSDSAAFEWTNGLAIYRKHVRVTDPRLKLTCENLTARLPQTGETNRPDHIVAETNVVLDFIDESGRKIHATGEKVIYDRVTDTTTNENLELSGHPRLETTNGWMTADVFVMNPTTRKIHGQGHYHFHSPTGLEAGSARQTKPPATAAAADIFSDDFAYDMKTGQAVYRGHARVNSTSLKLTCETLTAYLPGGGGKTNAAQNIVAETDVAIDFFDVHGEKTHATGDKAVYTSSVAGGATNQVLELSGNPVLERTNGWMMADLIVMDQIKGIIRGEGNHHTIYKPKPGKVRSGSPPVDSDTEIFSDRFEFNSNTGKALCVGNVRVLDPRRMVTCEKMTATVTQVAGKPTINIIVAEKNVAIDFIDNQGLKTHATGEIATYESKIIEGKAVEGLELSGHPKLVWPTASMTVEHAILIDKNTGKCHVVGNSQTKVLNPELLLKTNSLPVAPKPSTN